MYQQYRKVSGNICELVEISANFNDVNEMIIKREKENGLELDEILSKFIFKDWQVGDILLIQDYSVVKPIFDKTNKTIREMTREEICQGGDLSILIDGEVFKDGVIKTIPKPDGIKIEWEYPNWIEKATKDEQLEYYKNEILKNTRELLAYKESGFSNDELQTKIDILVEKHRAISEKIAREENKLY